MLKRLTVYLHNIVNLSELHQLNLFFCCLDLSFHLPSRFTIIMYMSKLHTMCVLTLWLTDQQLVPIALLQAGQLALLHTALVQYLVEVWVGSSTSFTSSSLRWAGGVSPSAEGKCCSSSLTSVGGRISNSATGTDCEVGSNRPSLSSGSEPSSTWSH